MTDSGGNASGHYWNDRNFDTAAYECASHDIFSAPGMLVILEGTFDAKRQRVAIDPDEIDEVARRLHQAKRYSRGKR
jgi:hypothetical protein